MQNRYVADVGDFGKFGLLRHLTGMMEADATKPQLRLGMAWYLHPDESHNDDGRHIGFLSPTVGNQRTYGECDPDLWGLLRDVVRRGSRYVPHMRTKPILPNDTVYHEAELRYWPGTTREIREVIRAHWLQDAIRTVAGADIVVVDPDNGIARTNDGRYRKHGLKFTYFDDLRGFWEQEQSIVVYHHLGHLCPAQEQIRDFAGLLEAELELGTDPIRLWFRRGTSRVFFVLPQPRHEEIITQRVADLMDGPWAKYNHFELVEG